MRHLIQFGLLICTWIGILISVGFVCLFSVLAFRAWLADEVLACLVLGLLAALAIYVMLRFGRADDRLQEQGRINQEKAEAERYREGNLEIGNSWNILLPAILIFCILTVGLVLFVEREDWLWVANITLLLAFLLHLSSSWIRLFGRLRLLLDTRGMHHFIYGTIPWEEIRSFAFRRETHEDGQSFWLDLKLNDLARFHAREPWSDRILRRLGIIVNPVKGHLTISLDYIDKSPYIVNAVAIRFRNRVQPPLEA